MMASALKQDKDVKGVVVEGPEKGVEEPKEQEAAKETYHQAAGTNDIIMVRSSDGSLHSSKFYCTFYKKVKPDAPRPEGRPKYLETVGRPVLITLNGVKQENIFMQVGADGFCTFADGGKFPPQDVIQGWKLLPGLNSVRFELAYRGDPRVLVADAYLFLYDASASFIVVDIDGTITRSDVPGLIMTFSPGTIDHTHPGVCRCLEEVAMDGANLLYLTSRPIMLAPKTRAFLNECRQDRALLPLGPLVTNKANLGGVLLRELITKDMHQFKTSSLLEITDIFLRAGRKVPSRVSALPPKTQEEVGRTLQALEAERPEEEKLAVSPGVLVRGGAGGSGASAPSSSQQGQAGDVPGSKGGGGEEGRAVDEDDEDDARPVFAAGVGNREHDGLAYRAGGVPMEFVFLIDPSSVIVNWSPSLKARKRFKDDVHIAEYVRLEQKALEKQRLASLATEKARQAASQEDGEGEGSTALETSSMQSEPSSTPATDPSDVQVEIGSGDDVTLKEEGGGKKADGEIGQGGEKEGLAKGGLESLSDSASGRKSSRSWFSRSSTAPPPAEAPSELKLLPPPKPCHSYSDFAFLTLLRKSIGLTTDLAPEPEEEGGEGQKDGAGT